MIIQCNNVVIRGWMMWNFLICGLSVGCTLVLYDGSPLRKPSFLWELVDKLGITVFGTSAKYIDQLSVLLLCSIMIATVMFKCRKAINLANITNCIHYDTYTQRDHRSHQIFLTMYMNTLNRTCYWVPLQVGAILQSDLRQMLQ